MSNYVCTAYIYSMRLKLKKKLTNSSSWFYLSRKRKWVVITYSNCSQQNGKLRVFVDFRKLNWVTKMDPFPLSYMDRVLEAVPGHEIYSTLYGFSRYIQVPMAISDQLNICYITEWGAFAYRVMSFRIKCALVTFQITIMRAF